MAADIIDLHKIYGDEYITPNSPQLVRNLSAGYLTIPVKGIPGNDTFKQQVKTLRTVAAQLKTAKHEAGQQYKECQLEALWWGSEEGAVFPAEPREQWNGKLLFRVPHIVSEDDRMATVVALIDEGQDPTLSKVHLETIKEGLCVQMLHVGAYDQEKDTVSRMESFTKKAGMTLHGFHHEVYLSEPGSCPAESTRTIIRRPVK